MYEIVFNFLEGSLLNSLEILRGSDYVRERSIKPVVCFYDYNRCERLTFPAQIAYSERRSSREQQVDYSACRLRELCYIHCTDVALSFIVSLVFPR